MTARLLDLDPDAYHMHPGFSASCAKTLIKQSALHAWQGHPAFGGIAKTPTKEMELGDVIHAIILGNGKTIRIVDHDDWRTNAAKDERKQAYDDGVVPILTKAHEEATFAAMAIMRQLAERGIKLDGDSEQAMEWHEDSPSGPVLCRGMMDHLSRDRLTITDLKTTHDASFRAVEKQAEEFGHAIQWAAYMSGHAKVFPDLEGHVSMRFIFAEPHRPYAINVLEPDGLFRELGQRRWARAVAKWGQCLKDKRWPAYESNGNRLSAPGWALAREEQLDEDS